MSVHPILTINMRRRNFAMHALLDTNVTDDLLCVSEPWFSRIGVARADDAREGVDVLGGAAHPNWELHYPYFTDGQRAKVMVYSRKFSRQRRRQLLPWKIVPRLDLCRHPCILVVDIHDGPATLRVITFYHDVDDRSSLIALTALDLDPTVPTILVGDFNLHSPSWSPPDWTRSAGSATFETWAASQALFLHTPPGTVTRRGADGERSSTIDLTWLNISVEDTADLSPPLYDWDASLGSDHCGVRQYWIAGNPVHSTPPPPLRTFDPDMGDEASETFFTVLDNALPMLWSIDAILTPSLIDDAASDLQGAVDAACSMAMRRRRAPGAHSHSWWTDECALAAQRVRDALTDDRSEALRELRRCTTTAKRTWADRTVLTSNVWDVAKWRHGRRQSKITALREADGSITFDHDRMASLLGKRFFADDPGDVQLHQHDDPPPRPFRTFHPFTVKELEGYLKDTSNTSTPGFSGQSWGILKLVWPRVKDHVAVLANACMLVGHHPSSWHKAMVVVIPKPNHEDYLQAKNYRPISLLECFSKLLEKAVSKRMLYDIDAHRLIPTTQFGTRAFSCTLDAGLTLLHDVNVAHRGGFHCAALMFDIKGFFDNVHKDRLAAILVNLGFPPGMCRWTLSFLSDRKVHLVFNGQIGPERDQPVGTPQGSPLSPVLSALYTSPLLTRIRASPESTLGMYVDDGVIFARGRTWTEVDSLLQEEYRLCDAWLWRNNLSAEPDKTELIYFRLPRARRDPPPDRLFLLDASRSTYYRVNPKVTVRYLGFFLHQRLDWAPHVDIMCNRARASLKALQVLGNTHRGLSMANWRLVFNAVCLPVLSYGCQLWATSRKYKSLCAKAQVVFNEGVRIIAGAFRTAPREPLHELTRVLPARVVV